MTTHVHDAARMIAHLKEVDELVKEWEPEAMVRETPGKSVKVSTPVIDRVVGARCTADDKENVINLASCNFWGLSGDTDILVRSVVAQCGLEHAQWHPLTGVWSACARFCMVVIYSRPL